MGRALDELVRHDGRHLVVTHGGPIRVACARLLGLMPHSVIPVSPASVTIIDAGSTPRLRAYNLTPVHAPRETSE